MITHCVLFIIIFLGISRNFGFIINHRGICLRSTHIFLKSGTPTRRNPDQEDLQKSLSENFPIIIMNEMEESGKGLLDYFGTLKESIELFVAMESCAQNLILLCDRIESAIPGGLSEKILRIKRRIMLVDLLQSDRDSYVTVVTFLSTRIPRMDLPNAQDIPYHSTPLSSSKPSTEIPIGALPDCTLADMVYEENLFDKALTGLFRKLFQIKFGFISEKPGIKGLVEEGRYFMLLDEATPEFQHTVVKEMLELLLTPFIPVIYRMALAGIVPAAKNGDPQWLEDGVQLLSRTFLPPSMREKLKPGQQLGPLPYAPYVTSMITPLFMHFLVGPAKPNRRKDGKLGGIVIEKCKSLQESGCKGLCLNQCKLPAQQFIAETLGIPLTVTPNFETQECQWSFGEEPLPPEEDPAFPSGCLVGCPSRAIINERRAEERRKNYLQ